MTGQMRREIEEIPQACARLLDALHTDIPPLARQLRRKAPAFLITVARGSSDHAAHFLKYAIELHTGLPVASLGPSLASVYHSRLKVSQGAMIAISQSGSSPDIVALARSITESGALTLALVNNLPCPLANACTHALDIQAGPERAVAATKSFVGSVIAGLALLAEWTEDPALKQALARLPAQFEQALALNWQPIMQGLEQAPSLYTTGRGPSLAIAAEAALKFKEVANMHAESHSSAEMQHGPVALVDRHFPILAFAARDAAQSTICQNADHLARRTTVYITSAHGGQATRLPFIDTGHPLTDALALIIPFYSYIEAFARAQGLDPDAPRGLNKITKTL